jgi:UDP-GlcNAc:undecaprenyl-phosphate GlcNAc-1-phosphate transferase
MDALSELLMAFGSSFTLLFLLRPLCIRLGYVDHPGGRKTHGSDTPLCGGLAIATSVVALGLAIMPSWEFAGFIFGLIVLLVLGAVDDRLGVPAPMRLVLQALAVAIGMCWIGRTQLHHLGALTGGGDLLLGGYATGFTVFAAVGIINAVNMIDGMDGIAGGFFVLLIGITMGAAGTGAVFSTALLPWLTMGSVLGFLVFNLRLPWQRQARVFLGDSGSLVLGYILVWFIIRHSQGPTAAIDPITAVWLFGLPLADTLYLMGRRLARGQSPLAADRYHFHHLLQRLGASPGWALYAWLVLAGCFMAVGLISQAMAVPESWRCGGFIITFALYCLVFTVIWARLDKQTRPLKFAFINLVRLRGNGHRQDKP